MIGIAKLNCLRSRSAAASAPVFTPVFIVKAGSANTNSVTTSGVDSTTAKLIVLALTCIDSPSVPTVSDSKGNTWIPLTNQAYANRSTKLFYCINPIVGSGHTFSASGASSQFPTLLVRGFDATGTINFNREGGNSGDYVVSLQSAYSGSWTPPTDNALVVTACNPQGGTGLAVDGGFTADVVDASGACLTGGIAYLIQTSAAEANPTWSWTTTFQCSTAIAIFTVSFTDLPTGLIGGYRLDEASGDAIDVCGKTLTAVGSPGAATGGRSFDGSTQWFEAPNNVWYSLGDSDLTVAAWVQLTYAGVSMDVVSKDQGSSPREYIIGYGGGANAFRFIVWDTATGATPSQLLATSFGTPPLDTWCFVVYKHDSVNNLLSIQVNDNPAYLDSVSYSGGIYSSSAAFVLGARQDPGAVWAGLIGDVFIWNKIVSSDKLTMLYNGGSRLPFSSW